MLTIARVYVWVMALILGALGLVALAAPDIVMPQLGLSPLAVKGTAEIRGLYGGAFCAWCAILIAGTRPRAWAGGLLVAMTVTMGGIAAARIASLIADGEVPFNAPALISEGLLALACWVLYRGKRQALAAPAP